MVFMSLAMSLPQTLNDSMKTAPHNKMSRKRMLIVHAWPCPMPPNFIALYKLINS
jgi:hypothetical protein